MTRLFVYSLLALALAVSLIIIFDPVTDPGYLLIAWRQYTFETSLLAFVLLLWGIWLLWGLLHLLFGWLAPTHWRALFAGGWRRGRRSATQEGLLHLARHNWTAAYNQLMKGTAEADAGLFNYLGAARAAAALQRREDWHRCLQLAQQRYPHDASTIAQVRAELLLEAGLDEQGMAVLEQLRKTAINDAHLLGMLKDVYLRLRNWPALTQLLPTLVKQGVIDADQQRALESRLLQAELQALADPPVDAARLAALRKVWKKAPDPLRSDPATVTLYARLLMAAGQAAEAGQVLEHQLGRQWSDGLVTLYGSQALGDGAQQLAQAEIWLKERPRNPALLLALGRICLRNQLWGKAREYLETCVAEAPLAEAHGELSRLARQLGDHAACERHFDRYLALATGAERSNGR